MIKSRLPLKYITPTATYENDKSGSNFLIETVVALTFPGAVDSCLFDLRLFICPSYHQKIGYKSDLYIKLSLLMPSYKPSLRTFQFKPKGQKKLNATNQRYSFKFLNIKIQVHECPYSECVMKASLEPYSNHTPNFNDQLLKITWDFYGDMYGEHMITVWFLK